MSNIKGYPAFPAFAHYLEPMFEPFDKEGNRLSDLHHCRLCKPEYYVTLAPGYVTCARCGVVILTGKEDDPMNEAMDVCESCADEIEKELTD